MKKHLQILVLLSFLISLVAVTTEISAQHIGSWGDQGNGRYKNPVLEGNFPDNDVIRMGNTFYMMTSTNHFAPGMMIMKSKDLVNWEYSNNIMPAPIKFDTVFDIGIAPQLVSRGTWAGSFGYNGEFYFAYWCFNRFCPPNNTYKVVFSKAKSMEGPWSEPEELKWPNSSSIKTTDPGVFWDIEKHKAWICLTIKNAVKLYSISWDGKTMLDNPEGGIVVTTKLEGESNKIYKFGDNYYVMNSHVGDNHGLPVRMEAFSRAKSMEGAWESRLVLENGNGTDRHPSQGTFIQLDDGSWWYIHQLARGNPQERYMGRPQFLEPVEWKDGWPLIGTDTDGDGIGEVIWEHKKPIDGFPVNAPATDDDFNTPALGLQWNWRFNPKMDRWSLTEHPGFLRLRSCASSSARNDERLEGMPNLIAQRLLGRYKNSMTTKFDISGMVSGQEVGFHVSAGENNVIGVKRDAKGILNLFFKRETNKGVTVQKGIQIEQKVIWFQSKIENGLGTFFYSLDGKHFNQFGDEVRLLFAGFTPNMVGFYSMNSEEKGYLDVDWFTYDYDGPKRK